MTTIQDLPSELKRLILLGLGSRDLARISRTAKEYCAEAEPLLYRSISIHTKRPKSLGCLKTLDQNKEKALFVNSLALNLLEHDDALEFNRIGGVLANTSNLTFLSLHLGPDQLDNDLTVRCFKKLLDKSSESIKHLRGLFINFALLSPLCEQCPNLRVVGLWNMDGREDTESTSVPKPLLLGLDFFPEDDSDKVGLSVSVFDLTIEAADLVAGRTPLNDFSPLGKEMRRDLMTELECTGLPLDDSESIDLNLFAKGLDAASLSRLVAVAEGMSGMLEYEETDNVAILYGAHEDIAWPELKILLNTLYPLPAPDKDPLGPVKLEFLYAGDDDLVLPDATIAMVVQALNDPALARLTRKAASIEFSEMRFEQTDGVWHI